MVDIPPLDGWVTASQAATALDITRQALHKKIRAGDFTTVRRLGDASKPFYIIREVEIDRVKTARKKAASVARR